jgi:hypothetical protein
LGRTCLLRTERLSRVLLGKLNTEDGSRRMFWMASPSTLLSTFVRKPEVVPLKMAIVQCGEDVNSIFAAV